LPRGAALIDLLQYNHHSPPKGGKGEFTREPRLLAFVVRPEGSIALVELGPALRITVSIAFWRPVLAGQPTIARADVAASGVRKLVWEPLEPHLKGVTTVLVAPDGALGLIPLAALPGKLAGTYLIEEYTVAVVPVPRMLVPGASSRSDDQTRASASSEAPSLLLVGDVDYGGEPGQFQGERRGARRSAAVGTRAGLLPNFKKLPATGVEIESVGRHFQSQFSGARPLKLDGDRATEAAFREAAPNHRFLHLATHGYFAPEALKSALEPTPKARLEGDPFGAIGVTGYHPGLLSGLALAGANRRPTPLGHDDGILTALEVAELDLGRVDLAVLSACETGMGRVAGGEGLLGLQRAFQVAGAHSVLASLWSVGDEPTRTLMDRFYENLWGKGQPPLEALRQAQLSMLRGELEVRTSEGRRGVGGVRREIRKRTPPFYWAAFVLSTDRL
jgi:CHAT domain-containing protein